MTRTLAEALHALGHAIETQVYFDTLKIGVNGSVANSPASFAAQLEEAAKINLREYTDGAFQSVSFR